MVGGTASLTVCPFLVTLRIISEGISGQEARGRNGWTPACRHARGCTAAVCRLRSAWWRCAGGRGVGIEPGGRGAAVPRTDPASVGYGLALAHPAAHATANANPHTEADADAHTTTDTATNADTEANPTTNANPAANPAANPLAVGVTNAGADRNAVPAPRPATNPPQKPRAECSRTGR